MAISACTSSSAPIRVLLAAPLLLALACGAAPGHEARPVVLSGALQADPAPEGEASQLTILGIEIAVSQATAGHEELGSLRAGDLARIEGTPDGEGGLDALALSRPAESNENATLEAVVASVDAERRVVSLRGLQVEIETDDFTRFSELEGSLLGTDAFFSGVKAGDRVEVQARNDGFPVARAIAVLDPRGDDCSAFPGSGEDPLRLTTVIASEEDIDADARTLVLLGVTVDIDSLTTLVDPDDPSFSLSQLEAGDPLTVRGIDNCEGGVLANRLERPIAVPDAAEIRGPVQAIDPVAGTITILGQTFPTDSATGFDVGGLPVAGGDFFGVLMIGDVVRITGAPGSDPAALPMADHVFYEGDRPIDICPITEDDDDDDGHSDGDDDDDGHSSDDDDDDGHASGGDSGVCEAADDDDDDDHDDDDGHASSDDDDDDHDDDGDDDD